MASFDPVEWADSKLDAFSETDAPLEPKAEPKSVPISVHLLGGDPSGCSSLCRGLGTQGHVFWITLMIRLANHLPGWCHGLVPSLGIDNKHNRYKT